MDTYISFWKKTFDISSYANRKEFNIGFWTHIICILCIFVIGPMLGLPKLGFDTKRPIFEMLFELNWQFYHVLLLAVFLIPIITLMMRRCRDLGAERIHALVIGFFPISYMFYFLLFAIMGQGLPGDVIWIEIIYYVIFLLPFLYLFFMLYQFTFKKGKL
ncbi:hypothetical protein [Macrococcus animalis]|uniref:hypothetical protein n=1 Tax=Macrococcus animalis TaxID=3395467 RepID=UPI0039BE145C